MILESVPVFLVDFPLVFGNHGFVRELIPLSIHNIILGAIMKKIIAFQFALLLIFVANVAESQLTPPAPLHINPPCSLSCCEESFPYTFCVNGLPVIQCSVSPQRDGAQKAYLPGCVKMMNTMPTDGQNMPNASPPQPAGLLSNDDLGNNSDEEAGAAGQQSSDATLFNQGNPPVDPKTETTLFPVQSSPGDKPTCGDKPTDDCVEPVEADYVTVDNPDDNLSDYETIVDGIDYTDDPKDNPDYIADKKTYDGQVTDYNNAVTAYNTCETNFTTLNDEYNTCESTIDARDAQWETDESNWNKFQGAEAQFLKDQSAFSTDQDAYTTIWNDGDAQNDATEALNNWYSSCSPATQGDASCCIHVTLDNSATDFPKVNGAVPAARTILTNQPNQAGFPLCGESSCANMSRSIIINISSEALDQDFQSTSPDVSKYSLFPVHPTGFYTNDFGNPSVASGFSVISFLMVVEHEIGHYLGLHHPDELVNDHTCPNCYTANPFIDPSTGNVNSSGCQTVMGPGNLQVNTPTYNLTDVDQCQFQKLYCPAACNAGVSVGENETGPLPEIHPNPSTGAVELDYTVTNHSFVQVTIYDVLGRDVLDAYSGYEDPGPRSMSLGTDALPSGHYVCRVTVGDRADYIDLVIMK